jgi:hypothetical protein
MEAKIKKVLEGAKLLHSLGSYSSVMGKASEDGLLFSLGASKEIYVPLSKLRVFLDDWDSAPDEAVFDPWEVE